MKSRSISNELWLQDRSRLIFYFTRRVGSQNAEDLAQSTIMTMWRRDFEFEKPEDFLKVCFGFARKILQAESRDEKYSWDELDPDIEHKTHDLDGLKGAEIAAFLEEVKRKGQELLDAEDWELIEAAAHRDGDDGPVSGRLRTKLHRVRNEFAKMMGWKKKKPRRNKR